ncbi:MAG: YkgJ family cysteine cluster protein [Campylobacteraceae bacterium]|jgi:Fe-S-cluster containining protein|nr:YkgJ family cysteine cluster protein [Campylobacteraceae bacterium]
MPIMKSSGYNFAFNPEACKSCRGKCCIGDSGYIWVNSDEIVALIEYLKIDEEGFKEKYIRKIGFRYSLKEVEYEGGFACIFFDMEKRCCKVYHLRPNQCKSYPFWEHFKKNQQEVEDECIGIVLL